jgi:hypothetical protein
MARDAFLRILVCMRLKSMGSLVCLLPPTATFEGSAQNLFEGQIIQDGLKEYMIPEYMFYDGAYEDENLWVDIGEFVEKRVSGGAKYISQFGPGWNKYKAHLAEAELKQMKDSVRAAIRTKGGRPIEDSDITKAYQIR